MKNFSILAAGSLALLAATPAHAGVTIDPDGAASGFSTTSLLTNTPFTINFGGQEPGVSNIVGLTAQLILTLTGSTVGATQTTYSFNYTMNNTSGAPLTGSRIVAFGFDTAPTDVGGSITSASGQGFSNVRVAGGQISSGITVGTCASTGNTCSGGGNGGIGFGLGETNNTANLTDSGVLTLIFNNPAADIALSNFVVRYQSVTGSNALSGSAVGRPTGGVPEPTTWAMMLIGFGLVGGFMRSSKGANVRTRIAFN